MLTIRRLYLYAMSGVALAVLASGLRLLVGVLFDSLALDGDPALTGNFGREQLSLAGALIGVGLPAWAIHWALVRRSLRADPAGGEVERRSIARAAYLSIVLALALFFLVMAVVELLRVALQTVLNLRPEFDGGGDVMGSAATILVAGAAWAFHVAVRRSDMAAGPLDGGAVLWPRVYLYGTQLVALFMGSGAFGAAVHGLADRAAGGNDPSSMEHLAYSLPGNIAAAAVTGLVFVVHAVYARRLVVDPGWRGASERASRTRIAFLAILLGGGLAFTILGVGESLRAVLLAILGEVPASLGQPATPGGLPRATLVPLVALLPWLGAAWHGRRQLLTEARGSGDAGRGASATRLERYIGATVGLAFGAIAMGWLVGLAIDALMGGDRVALSPDSWRHGLASLLPNAILGFVLWAWRWSEVTAGRTMNPVAEAGSGIRRATLLAILGVSLSAGVGALALILYRLFGSALGVGFEGSLASELSTPIGALIVAAGIALYHGLLVREDARLRTATEVPRAETVAPAVAPVARVERRLRLSAGSGADLDAALAAARRALPPGAEIHLD